MNNGDLVIKIVEVCNKEQMCLKDAVSELIEDSVVDIDSVNTIWSLIFEYVRDESTEDEYIYVIKRD
jgi:hypothetical protein